jgi:hypothetical protein
MGRKPIGRKAMTPTEMQRRWRAKKRAAIWGDNTDQNARRPTPRRADLDFWPTPPCLRIALVRIVLPYLPPGPIWEAAAGDGALVDALTAAGRTVIASDVNPQRKGILQRDFLDRQLPPCAATLVTNPPFGELGDRFLRRTLERLDAGEIAAAVLLQRADAGGTGGRAKAFNRAACEFTCTWRPVWIPGSQGGGRWWFSWFVWIGGRDGPPVHHRIEKSMIRA